MAQKKNRLILACIENLKDHIVQNTSTQIICTNKFTSTLSAKAPQISQLKKQKHVNFYPHYQPALHLMRKLALSCTQKNSTSIIVGHPHQQFVGDVAKDKVLTLEEMCSLFPGKVPFFPRPKDCSKIYLDKLEKRLGINLEKQPHISGIMAFYPVSMWDQAIQIILDHQPAPTIIPFSQNQPTTPTASPTAYTLSHIDFLSALKKTHQTIHKCQLTTIIDFNEKNQQVQYFLKQNIKKNESNQEVIVDQDLVSCRKMLDRDWPAVKVVRFY